MYYTTKQPTAADYRNTAAELNAKVQHLGLAVLPNSRGWIIKCPCGWSKAHGELQSAINHAGGCSR